MARQQSGRGNSNPEVRTRATSNGTSGYSQLAIVLTGLVFGLALVKFGNPVIFEGKLPPPSNLTEIIYFNWPIQWGWMIAAVLGLLLLPLFRWSPGVPKWLIAAPLVWLVWQWVATADSIQPGLSRLTVIHFTFTTGFFICGLLATRGVDQSKLIWLGVGIGLCLVMSSGIRQEFGGLDDTREFYEKLAKGEQPPEVQAQFDRPEIKRIWQSPLFQMKVNSRRIYSTLFYPNTLAGVMLLLTPSLLAAIWFGFQGATATTRAVLAGLLGLGAAGCLVWSGSKAGWLIALFQIGLVLFRSSIPARYRRAIIISVVVLGVSGLVVRNLGYFKKGATSVSARTDYWVSAGETLADNPLTGTGPGTFGESYSKRKAADSEMARLAHNDFIQQASDSGLVGFASYLVFVVGGMWWLYRMLTVRGSRLTQFIYLGLLGWAIQSLSEFGLYVPAIAWPAFFLMGMLFRDAVNPIDTPPETA